MSNYQYQADKHSESVIQKRDRDNESTLSDTGEVKRHLSNENKMAVSFPRNSETSPQNQRNPSTSEISASFTTSTEKTIPLTLPGGQVVFIPLSQIEDIAAKNNIQKSIERPINDREPGSTINTSIGEGFVIKKLKIAFAAKYGAKKRINIRNFYLDKETGEVKPTKSGIALDSTEWETLKSIMPALEKKLNDL